MYLTKIKEAIAKRANAPAMEKQNAADTAHMARTNAEIKGRQEVANTNKSASIAAAQASSGTDKVKTYEDAIQKAIRIKNSDPTAWKANPNNEQMLTELQAASAKEKIYSALPAVMNSLVMEGKEINVKTLLNGIGEVVKTMSESPTKNSTPEGKWNEEWAALKPGESKVGPDGKTYTKGKK